MDCIKIERHHLQRASPQQIHALTSRRMFCVKICIFLEKLNIRWQSQSLTTDRQENLVALVEPIQSSVLFLLFSIYTTYNIKIRQINFQRGGTSPFQLAERLVSCRTTLICFQYKSRGLVEFLLSVKSLWIYNFTHATNYPTEQLEKTKSHLHPITFTTTKQRRLAQKDRQI